jgi:diadenylate cyclase
MGEFGWRDAIELLIFWIGIYVVLRSLRGTRGIGVLKGTATFVLAIYVVSKGLYEYLGISLARITFLIESLAPAALVAFVVIFQPEVRRGLTRLGERPFSFLSGRGANKGIAQEIADACSRLSRRRRGALIVLERTIGFRTIVESGVNLNAELAGPLLEAIFEPSGPLHDGAVVIRGNSIVAGSCLLPLSDNPDLDVALGTRHRAALGLSEETDAVVIVVSEETGRISVACRGRLRVMRDTKELVATLDLLLDGSEPEWATEARPPGASPVDRDASADSSRRFVRRDASGDRPGSASSSHVDRGGPPR